MPVIRPCTGRQIIGAGRGIGEIDPLRPGAAAQRGENVFYIEMDFNSDEALYMQLCHQIILGIATDRLREGDALPSVRQLADNIGINMHTVNKAYTILKQEGFVKLDRRRGAVVSMEADKREAMQELRRDLSVVLAKAICKNISREEVHKMVDSLYDAYMTGGEV